jgi:hypothetical protein
MYLLIQDCYPNVYDFPGNTLDAIANGATIKLIMKKNFIGKPIAPVSPPRNVSPALQPVQPQDSQAPATTPAFCSRCGNKLSPDSVFCSGCGNKVG